MRACDLLSRPRRDAGTGGSFSGPGVRAAVGLSRTGYTGRSSFKGRPFLAIFGKHDPTSTELREAPANDGPRGPTVIGPQARVVGEISGDEDVLIEGRLEGKIRTDRKVTIGGTGDIVGDVLARSVVVAGKVEGQIRAQERAELLPSASVNGSVQAPKVVIAEGAQLQGSVAMSPPDDAASRGPPKPLS